MTQRMPGAQRPGPWWAAARAHALTAATLHGLAVFPLSRSKLPALPSAHPEPAATCTGECGQAGHGVHDATADPARVRALFAAAPWAAGYGIACGPAGLLGLDLDRKNGVDGVDGLRALAARHGFQVPRTVTVATPSGGWHLWLTASADVTIPNTAGLLAPGIDTRGTGGYLVGPGSLGPKGRYRFAVTFSQSAIAEAPPAITDLLTARQAAVQELAGPNGPGGGVRRSRGHLGPLVRFVLNCGPNDLNNRLYWAARTAFESDAIDPDTATAELLAAAVSRGHPETPARRTIASAAKGAARTRKEASS
ncbi:bifunctional DNA primase/polymerase [Streptomyces sp. NPDC021100]|uniref:bifunctional DNA primase/polymerase n=1 Tax=Streptomyces sp. NPDC021100 TaxID=3365114 RepID=UPI0037A18EB3